MRKHEYYEELCALLPIGQLSVEEWEELAEHLRGCKSCQNATDEFSIILEKMPVGDLEVDEKALTTLQGDSYRTRFLDRAISEGVPFSDAVTQPKRKAKSWSWPQLHWIPTLAAATAALVVGLSLGILVPTKQRVEQPQPIAQNTQAPKSAQANTNVDELAALVARTKTLEEKSQYYQGLTAQLKEEVSKFQIDSSSAKQQLAATMEELRSAQRLTADAQHRLDTENDNLKRLRSEKEAVDAALVDQQFKISELTTRIREKDALADRERQLDEATKDVRDLMGARNLHILDVSDVDGNGRASKTFGRVFFVEEKSLIFYAFDLGDRGNPSKVSFQAWAQGGRKNTAKNLGVFYVDDRAQKRWVLKVSDPEKLRAVDSLFVTLEPLGGADRPTGKKLLYAYVGSQANHP